MLQPLVIGIVVASVFFAGCQSQRGGRFTTPKDPRPTARRSAQVATNPPVKMGPALPPPAAEPPPVREPAVAGMFYPGDAVELRESVTEALKKAPALQLQTKVGAIISPHAGYVYSGETAARAFKAFEGRQFDTVVIVAGSHRARYRGYSIWWRGAYRTPLGEVPIDEEFARLLFRNGRQGTFLEAAHNREHSLEVMLPFLTVAIGKYRLVPVVIGEQSPSVCRELATAIVAACRHEADKKVLLVASTDLSHYHSLEKARELDGHLVEAIKAYDPERFIACVRSGKAEACGYGPVYAVMTAARRLGYEQATVTGYDTSARASGDTSRVVGYVSAVLHGTGKVSTAMKTSASSEIFSLSREEKVYLLELARNTIAARLANEDLPKAEARTEKLGQKSGAFVTLKKGGELRGCIGFIVAREPLVETIRDMAQSAAFNDPRFPAVTAREVDALEIEISVLSPFRKIDDPNTVEVGVHGIKMSRGYRSGLLLPQVATEYGWDRQTFLEHTCMKAGLPTDAWTDPSTDIEVFSAEIFNEEQFGLGHWKK